MILRDLLSMPMEQLFLDFTQLVKLLEVFMEKTNTAVLGLAALINAGKIDEDVRLYATYKKLQSWGGALLLRLLQPVLAPWIFGRLSAGRGSVAMFDLYKLMVLCAAQPTVGRKIS